MVPGSGSIDRYAATNSPSAGPRWSRSHCRTCVRSPSAARARTAGGIACRWARKCALASSLLAAIDIGPIPAHCTEAERAKVCGFRCGVVRALLLCSVVP